MDYMDKIIEAVAAAFGVTPDVLLDPKDNMEPAFSARAALTMVLSKSGEDTRSIARILMLPSTGYVDFLVRRHYDMVQREEGYYRERYAHIIETLERDQIPA